MVRKTSWWRIAPRLAFTLPVGEGEVTGLVEIRVWPWLALRGFRVSIADRVVYAEGKLKSTVIHLHGVGHLRHEAVTDLALSFYRRVLPVLDLRPVTLECAFFLKGGTVVQVVAFEALLFGVLDRQH